MRLAPVVVAIVVTACAGTPSDGSATPPAGTETARPTIGVTSRPRPSPSSTPVTDVRLEVVADGLAAPVGLVSPGDGSGRAFVLDQTGLILTLRDNELLPEPFLDLTDRLVRLNPEYDERGLLGLAFHSDFATNGRFVVYYSASATGGDSDDHDNVLSEFRIDASGERADPGSEREVLRFGQPQPNHSGGGLGFGPDGHLYLGTGDGGGRGDADVGHSPGGNAQDPTRLLGKILRLDIDAADDRSPEIYALGFRNPWRLGWEPAGDRRLLVSDVGFGRYEELDVVEQGGNYGWRIREGRHCLDLADPLAELETCPDTAATGEPLIDPILEYSHQEVGLAIVGGYVYRGSDVPELRDRYVFGDWSADWQTDAPSPRGSLLVADPQPPGIAWTWERLTIGGGLNQFVTGLGEDSFGELYVMTRRDTGPFGQSGVVYRIAPAG